ncbi:MAG: hypothetical protein HY957_00320 [Nitrospirae bacterium]|nr:hypothetical protein [Nitrospirota bacterium]
MPVSVRLDKETEELLNKASKIAGTPKSKLMKNSIKEYCAGIIMQKKITPYELSKDLIGKQGSGRKDLSMRGEEIMREMFKKKKHDRN